MATGVCKICGRTFSNSDANETVCASCRYQQNWDRLLTANDITTPTATLTVGSTVEYPMELTIKAQKIVLENGGVQLVIDNDTIKAINSIEVNGIKFERV